MDFTQPPPGDLSFPWWAVALGVAAFSTLLSIAVWAVKNFLAAEFRRLHEKIDGLGKATEEVQKVAAKAGAERAEIAQRVARLEGMAS